MPRFVLTVVDLWVSCRRGAGMFGGASLPCAGGVSDQPAALMDAFVLLDRFAEAKE